MTIVVAGFDRSRWSRALDAPPVLADLTGAYVLGDSRLSRRGAAGRAATSNAARKVEKIAVRVGVPYFIGEMPTARVIPHLEWSCGIAFAGNEFLGRTVVSAFARSAASLVYTWVASGLVTPGRYAICTSDSPQAIAQAEGNFDEDIDFRSDELPTLTSSFLADLLQGELRSCIDDILWLEKDNEFGIRPYLDSEFLLISSCQGESRGYIYRVRIGQDVAVEPPWLKPELEEIVPDGLVVLGSPSWKEGLEAAQRTARRQSTAAVTLVGRAMRERVDFEQSQNFVGGPIHGGYADPGAGFEMFAQSF